MEVLIGKSHEWSVLILTENNKTNALSLYQKNRLIPPKKVTKSERWKLQDILHYVSVCKNSDKNLMIGLQDQASIDGQQTELEQRKDEVREPANNVTSSSASEVLKLQSLQVNNNMS